MGEQRILALSNAVVKILAGAAQHLAEPLAVAENTHPDTGAQLDDLGKASGMGPQSDTHQLFLVGQALRQHRAMGIGGDDQIHVLRHGVGIFQRVVHQIGIDLYAAHFPQLLCHLGEGLGVAFQHRHLQKGDLLHPLAQLQIQKDIHLSGREAHVLQRVQQVVDGCHGTILPASAIQPLLADKSAPAPDLFNDAFMFQLIVGPLDRTPCHPQPVGKLLHRGQLGTGYQCTGLYRRPDLIHQLLVDRDV